MFRKFLLASVFVSLTLFAGCPNSSDSDADSSTSDGKSKNLPRGMETKPVQPDGKTTPGIPDAKNANVMKKGTTPTPGIPDPKTIGKTPVPKGATPTPGIPSPEELKKQREQKVNPNDVNKAPSKTDSEVTSPIDRKRRVGKPKGKS